MEYTPIDSIHDIDPARISIRDLNKKFIDRDGNRFAIRFDLNTRKVEIVRLARTIEEARRIQNDIRSGKTSVIPQKGYRSASSQTEDLSESASASDGLSTDEFYSSHEPGEEPDRFGAGFDNYEVSESELFEELAGEMKRIQESQNAVTNGLKKSRVFDSVNGDMAEIQRKIDLESIKPIDEAVNYYKELTSYPRPVTHYLNKLTPKQKSFVEKISDETNALNMVKKFQIEEKFRSTLKQSGILTDYLRSRVNAITDEELAALPAAQTLPFKDITPSLDMIMQRVDGGLHRLDQWKSKAFPPEVL